MKQKFTLTFILLLFCSFVLFGCGQQETKEEENESAALEIRFENLIEDIGPLRVQMEAQQEEASENIREIWNRIDEGTNTAQEALLSLQETTEEQWDALVLSTESQIENLEQLYEAALLELESSRGESLSDEAFDEQKAAFVADANAQLNVFASQIDLLEERIKEASAEGENTLDELQEYYSEAESAVEEAEDATAEDWAELKAQAEQLLIFLDSSIDGANASFGITSS